LYTPGPDEKELATFGLSLEDYGDTIVEIWPENLPAFEVFRALTTQWRAGMNGPTGLDYNVLPELWRRLDIRKKERNRVFADLQEMERAALSVMARQREK